MSLTTSLAVFFIIWWTVLFAVLPWGIRSQVEAGEIAPGTDPGAPSTPKLVHKMIWTTVVAGLTFAAIDVVYSYHLLGLDDVAGALGLRR
jgi:predicted secreted protein